MSVPKVSFRDGSGALKNVNGHLASDGAYTFNSSPDSNITTFTYAGSFDFDTLATVYGIIRGSATKVVRVREIRMTPIADDSYVFRLKVYRGSDMGTASPATLVPLTPAAHEAAQSPTGHVYGINTAGGQYGTPPTNIGLVFVDYQFCADAGDYTKGQPQTTTLKFGSMGEQGYVLRGEDECLVFTNDGNATTTGGAHVYYTITLTEESE